MLLALWEEKPAEREHPDPAKPSQGGGGGGGDDDGLNLDALIMALLRKIPTVEEGYHYIDVASCGATNRTTTRRVKRLIGQQSNSALSLINQRVWLAISAQLFGIRNANRVTSHLDPVDREGFERSGEAHGRHA